MKLYNYIFCFNGYYGSWYAIHKDQQQTFFCIDKKQANGVCKSNDITKLIKTITYGNRNN